MKKGIRIELDWDGLEPGYEVVTGHLSKEDFYSVLIKDGFNGEETREVKHTYARFIPSKSRCLDSQLIMNDKKSRGCFPITYMEY